MVIVTWNDDVSYLSLIEATCKLQPELVDGCLFVEC